MPVMDGAPVGREESDEYECVANYEQGREWERSGSLQSPVGNACKCRFCLHRVHEGELPSCTTTCIGHTTIYGETNNPDSLVFELITQSNAIRCVKNPAPHHT